MVVSELTAVQVEHFRTHGFVSPIPLLEQDEVTAIRSMIDEYLRGHGRSSLFELTNPIDICTITLNDGSVGYEYNDSVEQADMTTFGFLMNLWRHDARFLDIGIDPGLARKAKALLGAEEVLLFEDNVIVKLPRTKYLPWHQDFSYWPLAEPRAVTFWIALDDIDATNGAMEVSPGTNALGPRLPVAFGNEQPFMVEEWPGVPAVPRDPRGLGHPVVTYKLRAGECGIHDALVWHGSTANTSDRTRYALVLRYVASGTIWLGPRRMAYDDIGCAPGEPLTGKHFPVAGMRDPADKKSRWTLPNR